MNTRYLTKFCSIMILTATVHSKSLPISDIDRFSTVVEHIKNYYVNKTEDNALFENAIRGMLLGLDPHSAYLDQEEFNNLQVSTSGKFGGLGIEVTLEDGFIKIISPIDGTPATRVGIQAGDIIIRLDDTPVKDLTLKEAVNNMRGEPGSKIILTIIRKGEDKPLRKEVTRDIIMVQSVRSRILEDKYAYVRVSQFQSDTGDELIRELNKIVKKSKLNGIILDLRNNPGGVLDSSVQIANAFLDKDHLKHDQMIVYTKGRLNGSEIKEKANGRDLLKGSPMVVLINGGSASASEIVAGALQDHNRAIIMGTKSFGKGSVQTILPLKDKRGLKLTTALYYTPKGRSIQATGIVPDIEIDNIKIDKPKNDGIYENLSLKESDLQGHIKNKDKAKKINKKDLSEESLIYSDYQLNQALNVLKGLRAFKEDS